LAECMTSPEEYRRFAKECLEIARCAKDQRTRATLHLMAQVWFRLAEEKVSIGAEAMVLISRFFRQAKAFLCKLAILG